MRKAALDAKGLRVAPMGWRSLSSTSWDCDCKDISTKSIDFTGRISWDWLNTRSSRKVTNGVYCTTATSRIAMRPRKALSRLLWRQLPWPFEKDMRCASAFLIDQQETRPRLVKIISPDLGGLSYHVARLA